jgi:hypothetical protein
LVLAQGTLNDWNDEFDDKMCPFVTVDRRGKGRKVTTKDVRIIVEFAKEYKSKGRRRIRLGSFTKKLKEKHKIPFSAKTVKDVLIANNLYKPNTRKKRPRFFQSLRQRIPNGLVSLDGSEITVWIDDRAYKFNLEMAVDVGTFANTAFDISQSETSDAYIRVMEEHRAAWGPPLGVLTDSGSVNLGEVCRHYLDEHDIEIVPAGPSNPKGNGTIEGAFSKLKSVLGIIRLDNSSPQALAKSVLDLVIQVYITMRNKIPLTNTKQNSSQLMGLPVNKDLMDYERRRLQEHNERRGNNYDPELKRLEMLHFMIQKLDIKVDEPSLKRAQKSIVTFDDLSIIEAEKAFIKAINRNSDRLNLAYFFGILTRIQKDRDDYIYEQHCAERYNYQNMLEFDRKQEKARQQQNEPTTVKHVVGILHGGLRAKKGSKIMGIAFRKAKEWTDELIGKYRYLGSLKKKFLNEIDKRSELTNEMKNNIMEIINGFLDPNSTGESVTPFS